MVVVDEEDGGVATGTEGRFYGGYACEYRRSGMMGGMVTAVTRQCESRRQRSEHAGTTKEGSRGEATGAILPQSFAVTTYSILHCLIFVSVCMCWRQAFPLTPHTMANGCPPYETDEAIGSGTRAQTPRNPMQNTAVAL